MPRIYTLNLINYENNDSDIVFLKNRIIVIIKFISKELNELKQEIKKGIYEAISNVVNEAVIAGTAIKEAHENFVEKGIRKYKLREDEYEKVKGEF